MGLETDEPKVREDRMPIRQLFWRAVSADNHNGALDVWLEQLMGREPFLGVRSDFQKLYGLETSARTSLKRMPLHHQLTQWLVSEERYLGLGKRMTRAERERTLAEQVKEHLHTSVAIEIEKLRNMGVVRTLMDVSAWESFSGTREEQSRAIEEKKRAVMEYLLPAWCRLLKAELDATVEKSIALDLFPAFICTRENHEDDALFKERECAEKAVYQKNLLHYRYEILRKLLDDAQQRGASAYGSATPDGETEQATENQLGKIQG